jgi:pimeloyl-ACP methyl ester carboxylesterase
MTAVASIALLTPGGAHDPNPSESQRRRVEIVGEVNDTTIGIVGWSTAGLAAVEAAARHPSIARLVLVNVRCETEKLRVEPAHVTAKTLLVFGGRDPSTGSAHGRRWQRLLPHARLEMVPDGDHDLLARVWPRILAHVAPGRVHTD